MRLLNEEASTLKRIRFKMQKVCSMNVDAESNLEESTEINKADGSAFRIKADPRITWLESLLGK